MSNNLLWRGILCLALAALAIFMVVPPREKINLGLDLQGGMHLTLRVKTADALRAETEKDMEALRRAAENEGLTGLTLKRTDDIHFELSGVPAGRESVIDKVKGDLFGGSIGQSARWESSRSSGTYTFTMSDRNQTDIRELAVNQALNTIRNRVDAFGVSEPLIARQGPGSERIVVQLPGVADPDRVRNLIKNTAFLEFRLVDAGSGNQAARSQEELAARYGGTIPETVEVLPQDLRNQEGQTSGQIFWALERRQIITGRDLRTAHPSQDQFGQPVVAFSLTPDGARQFGKATGENVGRLLAIVLDNKVQSAPSIHERITDNGQISGGFSAQEVQDLVTVLRSGALPAGIEYLEERTVGASLGADSVKKGLTSGLVATILVVLTMFVVYRLTGSNAVAALILNLLLLFGGLGMFHATLTLPGIAGIVLTIGMAVDANVLVFERIREELKNGRSVKSSIEAGFGKAFSAIFDSNVTTMLAAVFLIQFGTGPVRGFAITLIIGLLANMFAAVFFSRLLFDWAQSRRKPSDDKVSIWGFSFPATNFNFMRYRRFWVVISFLVIIAGVIALSFGRLNFGIDFTGGTQVIARFTTAPQVDSVRSALDSAGLRGVIIQRYGETDSNEILIRTPVEQGNEEGATQKVLSTLRAKFPDLDVRSTENVGPQVGSELRRKGTMAVILSIIVMLIYIWVRFELRFGIGAVMALIHDVLITLGLFAVLGFSFDLTSVAAFLTLIGYSVNDTVIIFDRVRENMRKMKSTPLEEVMNLSLNQTLSRTTLTVSTVLMASGSLLLLGGEVLRGFAFVLFFGTIIGTYSSIYIASPFALLWEKHFGKKARAERAAAQAMVKKAG